ncbi:MAG: hypothetical protein U0T73_05475 [Chitinophagales bacterium]
MDLILMCIFGGALYYMAINYNIRPWRWVGIYVGAFMATVFVAVMVLYGIYGQGLISDPEAIKKVQLLIPFTLLYQFLLFMYFRSMMKKYVAHLDKIDAYQEKSERNQPTDNRDFSHFR